MAPAASSAPDVPLDAFTERVPPNASHGVELELDSRRELRVVLPTELHRKLRSLKMLRGMNIGECVTQALEQYFHERPDLRRLVMTSPSHDDE